MKFYFIILITLVTLKGYSQDKVSSSSDTLLLNLDIKTKEELIKNNTVTNKKAIYKGILYPVYMNKKNKLFIVYPSKKEGYKRKYINL